MPDTKVSALSPATPALADVVPLVHAGASTRTTVQGVLQAFAGAVSAGPPGLNDLLPLAQAGGLKTVTPNLLFQAGFAVNNVPTLADTVVVVSQTDSQAETLTLQQLANTDSLLAADSAPADTDKLRAVQGGVAKTLLVSALRTQLDAGAAAGARTLASAATLTLSGTQIFFPNGTMSAPGLALAGAPGVGLGNTPAGFGIIHAPTVYTDVRANALAVRNSSTGAGGGISSNAASATVPNLCPDVLADSTTGIGRAGGGKLSLICTATEIARAEFSGGAAKLGFLGKVASPATAQTGGALTAGAAWLANEQGMVQTMWDALRTFGFLT